MVPGSYDMLNIILRIDAISFASSFKIVALIPSGPAALCGLSCSSSFSMPPFLILVSVATWLGLVLIICSALNSDSLIFMCSEKTDWNCLLRISAFCFGSVKRQPLNFYLSFCVYSKYSIFSCLSCCFVLDHVLWIYDLFYVIPVCLSHLSLDELFFFFELVDITLMVGFFVYFIHPVSPFNHLFYFFCYPREFVLSFGNFLRYMVVYALLKSIGESVPRLVYVSSYDYLMLYRCQEYTHVRFHTIPPCLLI